MIAILKSRWLVSFIGSALLGALVWIFTPLLPAFASTTARLGIVLALGLGWLIGNLVLDLRRAQRDVALARGVASIGNPGDAGGAEEAAALREKLERALALLKKQIGRRGYLYEQPWYAIIGPPGAGKTTALLNSGLKFPLAEQMGQGAVAGVGGTRLCDWWFTEDAVLIDTAGRYTTQDSNAAADRAGWGTFLQLLKQTRPRQPLNGLIVAFPLNDIAQASAAERRAHAAAIRERIAELETRLGTRMPVYVLFTKADLIAGFTEFFDDLDHEGRAQVWGVTFDLAADPKQPLAAMPGELDTLLEQLNSRLFERLGAERNPERRARIAMFPGQIASLRQPIVEFLQAALGGSAGDHPLPMLRGIYMTSGTQEGTPIDRLIGSMARAFGVAPDRAPSLRPVHGRSYFLEHLLTQVIFNEAELVARPAARRALALRAAALALAVAFVGGTSMLFWNADRLGQREIDQARSVLASYEQAARSVPMDPVADDDLQRLAPLLDQARMLPARLGAGAAEPKPWFMLGLSQQAKLAASADAVYRHALAYALLPRLLWRLETQLRGNLDRPDFLYEATRVYLMLGNAGPLDTALVHEWMRLDWQGAYPGAEHAALRASLLRHLDALLAMPLPTVRLDGELVAAARARFGAVSLAQRVYSRIRPSAAAQHLPPWVPSDALGAAGADLFVRASGKRLDDGIPGFFTVRGFHDVLLPLLKPAAREVLAESWVLGRRVDVGTNDAEMQGLEHAVVALYEADFRHVWDQMLADLNLVQILSLPQAAQDLYILAAPESPMRNLLVSIARQLTLSAPPSRSSASATVLASTAGGNSGIDDPTLQLRAVLGNGQPAQAATPLAPGHEIDEHYAALRQLVAGPAPPIDKVLRSLSDMQQQFAKMAATLLNGKAAPPPGGIDPALALQAEAASEPQPLARWLTEIATMGTALRSGDPRRQLAAVYNAPGGPAAVCPAVVDGHFPFVPGAAADASLADFARLFAPGGLLDGFVNTLLKPYLDTSGKTWRTASAGAGSPGVSEADLAQFQRAAAIRDAFFPKGGSTPSVRFDLTPLGADPATRRVVLDMDGDAIVYAHDMPRAAQLTWPAASATPTVSLAFQPPASAGGIIEETGPWAVFKLFRRGRMSAEPGSPDRYRLLFQIGSRHVAYEVHLQSSANPFAMPALQEFRCPTVRAN